ncbi:arylsulfatase [Rhodopirellula sp.]|nr:arylsulfatase [Rhodopirellula sp.]
MILRKSTLSTPPWLIVAIGILFGLCTFNSPNSSAQTPNSIFASAKPTLSRDQTSRPPNIIYVMADDLGYGDLSCYGQKVLQTPNLDRMAAEGMRFTDHYAGHTVCRPSRLVLWTGKHVGHTGLIGNRAMNLSGMEKTVAQRLQDAGYATGGIGKWALGNVEQPSEIENPGHPNANGFQSWFGYMNQGNAHNFFPPFLWDSKTQVFYPGNVLSVHPNARGRVSSKQTTYSHDQMTEAAFRFIRSNHQKPFLLHMHWTIPHANNEGGRVNGDGMEIPEYGEYASRDWPNPEKGFAAMIARMDRDMGRLFSLLKELDVDENTIVFFTSDNGPHREGGHDHEFFDSNGPLKGFKRSMHDGGIRVPLIARWPGKIQAGSISGHPSAFWDYLPTACELAGIPLQAADSKEIDGISYVPTLLGNHDQQQKHPYLYWASSEGETSVGVRVDHWKLVQYRPKKKDTQDDQPDWRLYDLRTDIGEKDNLANAQPMVVEQIIGLLEAGGLD